MRYPHIAARVFNTPLLITQAKLDAVVAFLLPRMGDQTLGPSPRLWADDDEGDGVAPSEVAYVRQPRGTAIIDVHGTLIHRGTAIEQSSGLTSYVLLSERLGLAMADPLVRHVVLSVDSPGGEAAGAFDFAAEVYAYRGKGKPLTACVSETACSGAYLIAAACDGIVTAATGYSGSIGVMTSRLDVSDLNAKVGIVVTNVYAGERKIDGHPNTKMSAEERATLEKSVGRLYDRFVRTIATYRDGKITEDAVRATQAGVFDGEEAVALGLADEIASLKDTVAQIEATAGRVKRRPTRPLAPSRAAAPLK